MKKTRSSRSLPDGAAASAAGPASPLAGRTVLVTGASSGIGAAIAEAMAARGAALIVMGRDRARLQRISAASRFAVRTVCVDFERRAALRRAIESLLRRAPRIDAIVHAAGSFDGTRLTRTTDDLFERLIQVNLKAALDLTVGLRTTLSPQSDVIFINSSIVQRPAKDAGLYAVTKHALRAAADSLREELNGAGIRVTSVFPGRTATPMQRQIVRREAGRYRPERLIQPADIASAVCSIMALPRTVEITEIFLRPALPPMP